MKKICSCPQSWFALKSFHFFTHCVKKREHKRPIKFIFSRNKSSIREAGKACLHTGAAPWRTLGEFLHT